MALIATWNVNSLHTHEHARFHRCVMAHTWRTSLAAGAAPQRTDVESRAEDLLKAKSGTFADERFESRKVSGRGAFRETGNKARAAVWGIEGMPRGVLCGQSLRER